MKSLKILSLFLVLGFFLFEPSITFAQTLRGLVNDGVKQYKDKNYSDAEVNFKKGIEKSPENFQAKFNLGDALFKQQRYDEAINSYQSALPMTQDNLEKAKVHYNIGNSLLKGQKVKESIEEYKKSLRLNPNDEEAKYNLSYALELLKNQNQKQQNKQDKNKNQDKDQNKDQNKNQDQNKDQQQKDQQQNQQDQKNQESQQDNTKQQQQQPQKISKEEAERILQALKNNEKDLQKELRKIKGKKVKTDKDW
jgi:Ca-activated chloride channel homolog